MFKDALQKLQQTGTVGVLPTDTVYGLVACASDQQAVQRLYDLKQREGKPGTLIAASIQQFIDLGLKPRYLKAVEQFWPGAVSVIIPCGPELTYLHEGKFGLAVRIPESKELREFLKQTGPLLTSSANHPGEPTATTLDAAKKYFGNNVDFCEDGGDLSNHTPSTIIRIVDDAIEIVREGAVKIKENE
jgi:L-threonylcarbamoyladenylate synthase